MTRADWTALPTVFLAALFVAGEVCGFMTERFCGLWGWAALGTAVVCAAVAGTGGPVPLRPAAFMLGLVLAWRSENCRRGLDEYARSAPSGGGAPVYELKVEGDVRCRRGRRGRLTVVFRSHIGNVPVKVIAPMPASVPSDGETWKCRGWLSLRKGSSSRYSRRTLWVGDRDLPVKVRESGGFSPARIYRRVSGTLARKMSDTLCWSREPAAFCNAILFGRREGIPRNRLEVFSRAGTVHVFAISGLHVMLVAGLLSGLLSAAGMSLRMRAACSIPVLAAYVMMIGAPPSALRAALMASLYQGARLFGRKPDSLAAWAAALFVVCGVSPEMILDVGCVLSFAVMLGIVLWIRWAGQFASPADRFLELAEREKSLGCGLRKSLYLSLYRKSSWLLGGLGISFAAWIAGTPVAAAVFGRVNVLGVFLNLAVIPLAGFTVAFGLFGSLWVFVSPPVGALFGGLSALSVCLMSVLSGYVASVPFSCVDTLPWDFVDCVMWYAAWGAFFALLSRHLPRKRYIGIKEWE